MKGYNSLAQFVQDYSVYISAKKIDPGKEGETITSYLKKRINKRLSRASKQFKAMLKKKNYSIDDLKLIAMHDYIKNLLDLEYFIRNYFETNYVGPQHYKKLLKSSAFKSGRLKRLYEFVPVRIETKNDFIRFIKMRRRGVSKQELTAIMNSICKKRWHSWINELIDDNKIREDKGRWSI